MTEHFKEKKKMEKNNQYCPYHYPILIKGTLPHALNWVRAGTSLKLIM